MALIDELPIDQLVVCRVLSSTPRRMLTRPAPAGHEHYPTNAARSLVQEAGDDRRQPDDRGEHTAHAQRRKYQLAIWRVGRDIRCGGVVNKSIWTLPAPTTQSQIYHVYAIPITTSNPFVLWNVAYHAASTECSLT